MKIKLAAIAKNEGAYIPQWIYHHFHFGFDFIEIWINNTTDNSVQILENIKDSCAGAVDFVIGDKLFDECSKNNWSFQIQAYKKIFEESKNNGFTHIMFLDLDEYWMPANFSAKIYDCVSDIKNFDAISFQWFFDEPEDKKKEFQLPSEFHSLQKNRHVKTILKISERVISINMHNHIVDDGVYVLSDGAIFEENDDEQFGRAKVSMAQFNSKCTQLDHYFILHTIYRSKKEYVASLLRGRAHVSDKAIFKRNRYGYILEPYSCPGIEFNNANNIFLQYEKGFINFCNQAEIFDLLEDARQFINSKFEQATEIMRDSPEILGSILLTQMRGIRINDMLKNKIVTDGIVFSIDSIKLESIENILVLTGWAFDSNSSDRVVVALINTMGTTTSLLNFLEIDRPDVVRAHPDALISCGFSARFSFDHFDDPINFLANAPYFIRLSTASSNKSILLDLTKF